MLSGGQRIQVPCLQRQDQAARGLAVISLADRVPIHGDAFKAVKCHRVPDAALNRKNKVFPAALDIPVSFRCNGINRILFIGINIDGVLSEYRFRIRRHVPAAGLAAGSRFCAGAGNLLRLQFQRIPFEAGQHGFHVIAAALVPFTVNHAEDNLHADPVPDRQAARYILDIVIAGHILLFVVRDPGRGRNDFPVFHFQRNRAEGMAVCQAVRIHIAYAGFRLAAFRNCLGFRCHGNRSGADNHCDALPAGVAVGAVAGRPVPDVIGSRIGTCWNFFVPAENRSIFRVLAENILHRTVLSLPGGNKRNSRTRIVFILPLGHGFDGCGRFFRPYRFYLDHSVYCAGAGNQYFRSHFTDQIHTVDFPMAEFPSLRRFKAAIRKHHLPAFTDRFGFHSAKTAVGIIDKFKLHGRETRFFIVQRFSRLINRYACRLFPPVITHAGHFIDHGTGKGFSAIQEGLCFHRNNLFFDRDLGSADAAASANRFN